ncbi:hypothetical protein ZIOFF_053392 [Zingiber officinale]|uniref:PPIase cyclophilin-type domain-containing protein n=1 Tax=Zingiber officinale TaxID=94328 RepID=A0A8J5FIN1_ZINOF|nr:hypothetical protein ZIOFF_053392 [Zingiber officinale]
MKQILHQSLNPQLPILQSPPTPPATGLPFQVPRPHKLLRRDLAVAAASTLPLLVSTFWYRQAKADEVPTSTTDCSAQTITEKAFLDVAIDGAPAGRITVGLYGDAVPFGSSRFADLVTGAAGISYRRKEFVKIVPGYVQHSGVRSYGVDVELARRGGGGNLAAENLVAEWESLSKNCSGTKNAVGSLGLIIRDPTKPPPKLKLVAREGKLEIDAEEIRKDPNGTEFVIVVKDSPELDASTLVIGRVVEGMDVVEKISKVKTVQENTSSPYFRVAKLIGDKRAVVAERGFNRPWKVYARSIAAPEAAKPTQSSSHTSSVSNHTLPSIFIIHDEFLQHLLSFFHERAQLAKTAEVSLSSIGN